MKKILYAIGVFTALLTVSCVKETIEPVQDNGFKLKFVGQAYEADETDDTKISVGEKNGTTYPLLWSTGDVISVWHKDIKASDLPYVDDKGTSHPGNSSKLKGLKATLYSGNSGYAQGVFQANSTISVSSNTQVMITYPGTATYADNVLKGNVAAKQTQYGANSSIHLGASALAYATTTINAGQTEDVQFSLSQKTAFVKVSLTTSEYSSYKLKGVRLIAPGKVLSGEMSYNTSTNTFEVAKGADNVSVQLYSPVDFSGTQDLYLTAIPANLSGTKVTVSVEMVDAQGYQTVTIPVQVDGKNMTASSLSVINVNVSSSSISDYPWYQPVETRDLLGAWAYGAQNTYFIEQKASAANSIEIDVRARGDFTKVEEPKYYGMYMGSSEMSGRKLCYVNDDPENYGYDKSKLVAVPSSYKIKVNVFSQADGAKGRWSVVAIYNADKEVIWSFMISRYLTADAPEAVTYTQGGFGLLDRNLGASHSYEYAKTLSTPQIEGSDAFFQWGRKDPTMWSNNGSDGAYDGAEELDTRYKQRLAVESDDIAYSIANPGIAIAYDGTNNISRGDWKCDEHASNLWGYDDATQTVRKSIYDPCPAGYRVPDKTTLEYIYKNAERWEIDNSHASQPDNVIKSDNPFAGKNSVLAIPLGSDSAYDYWPFAGARWVDGGTNWGNRVATNNRHGALYWSNQQISGSEQPYALQYCYLSGGYSDKMDGANKSRAFAIRCQVDTENR